MSNSNLIGSALLSIPAVMDLPSATNDVLGGVMVQANSGILVDSNGNISIDNTEFLSTSQAASTYATQLSLFNYLTTASAAATYATQADLGNYALLSGANFSGPVEVPTVANGDSSNNAASTQFVAEAIAGSSGYTLPVATASNLGGVKVGSGLSVDISGNVTTVNQLTNSNTDYVVVSTATEQILTSHTVASNIGTLYMVCTQIPRPDGNPGSIPPNNFTLTMPTPLGDGHRLVITNTDSGFQYSTIVTADGSTLNNGNSGFPYPLVPGVYVYFSGKNTWLNVGV